MIETTETQNTKIQDKENGTLDVIMPAIRQLTTHDKLVLIRILADELATENSIVLSIPPGVYEFYTPYEIDGITDDMIDRFESLPQPMIPPDEN
jgi:hypothetical protein